MRLLLDTHTFLWWITDSPYLSKKVRAIIKNKKNDIFFSSASAWEIVIKAKIKRLNLTESPEVLIPAQLKRNAFQILPILINHALKVYSLPDIHQDPFDRILIAQSLIEKMPLITIDLKIKEYNLETIWD